MLSRRLLFGLPLALPAMMAAKPEAPRSRPGTEFIAMLPEGARPRMIPFTFASGQTCILMFDADQDVLSSARCEEKLLLLSPLFEKVA